MRAAYEERDAKNIIFILPDEFPTRSVKARTDPMRSTWYQ